MKDQIHFLGRLKSKNSLTLSTIAIDKDGKRTVIDCGKGVLPGNSEDDDAQTFGPDISSILDENKIDRVISTHGHMDHIGYVPALCGGRKLLKDDAKIWGTPQTNKILNITAWDDLRQGTNDFGLLEYADMISRLEDIPKPGENIIDGESMYFVPIGHMPGATSIMFKTRKRTALVFGDACWHNQATVQSGLWPSEFPKEWIPDELWNTDLTYASGDMSEDKSYEQKKSDFHQAIIKALELDKTVVIQGFATSKIPNVAHDLAAAGIPSWIDSAMAWKILIMYHLIRWSERDNIIPMPGNVTGIDKVEGRRHREDLMLDGKPKVILATGGMGDFGPVLNWYQYGLSRKDFAFFPTSWLAPGSNGARLVNLASKYPEWRGNEENRIVRLRFKKSRDVVAEWKDIPVRAEVQRFGLSSHGTFANFIHFLRELIDIRGGRLLERIFLTHGTEEAMNRAQIELRMFAKEVIPGYLIKTAEII